MSCGSAAVAVAQTANWWVSIPYARRVFSATARRRRSSSNVASAASHAGLMVSGKGAVALIGPLFAAGSPRPCLRCASWYELPHVRTAGLRDVHGRADRDSVVEVDHVRDRHADAPVRCGRPERTQFVGPVDPGAVEDAHPASLDRILRSRRDRLTGERPGPRAVGHVPGGVQFLVLDVVEPGGRL